MLHNAAAKKFDRIILLISHKWSNNLKSFSIFFRLIRTLNKNNSNINQKRMIHCDWRFFLFEHLTRSHSRSIEELKIHIVIDPMFRLIIALIRCSFSWLLKSVYCLLAKDNLTLAVEVPRKFRRFFWIVTIIRNKQITKCINGTYRCDNVNHQLSKVCFTPKNCIASTDSESYDMNWNNLSNNCLNN